MATDTTRRTSAEIEFGLVDVGAKDDSMLQVSDEQSFSDVEQLEQDGLTFPKYTSLEWNRWLLNNTFFIKPVEKASIGWWSIEMSGADCVFSVPPTMTISFQQNHSSIGLTLTFLYEDWAGEINAKWYNGSNVLAEKTDCSVGTKHQIMQAVENYNKIILTFNKSSKPFRFLHITRIDYGITKVFGNNELMEAVLHEEIDPLSEEITINTNSFKVHSSDADFSILNPQGIYRFLQQRQKLSTYEMVGVERRFLGAHYLSEWSGENENTFTMKSIDAIGLMDGSTFMGGMYVNKPAKDLLEEIVSDAGFVVSGTGKIMVNVDPAVSSMPLTGHISICSHRDAIQQVAFAVGAVVDTSGTDEINVYKANWSPDNMITRNRKITGQTVELDQLVTGVEVVEHAYGLSQTAETLFEGILPAGENLIKFNDPASNITATGGTLKAAMVNYAIVTVSSEQNVVVTGKKYIDSQKVVGVYMGSLPAGQTPNILSVEDATLVSSSNSKAVAEWVYALHQKRVKQNFQFIRDTEQVGTPYNVETLYNQEKSGLLTKLDTDLTKGFIGKAVVIGE